MDKFTPVTPHIFKIEYPLGFGVPVAVWLIKNDRGWTVVDAGLPWTIEPLLNAILAHTGGAPPYRLIFTHGHMDHGGAAAVMVERWQLSVAAGRAEIPYLLGAERYNSLFPPGPRRLVSSPPPLPGLNVEQPLDDGMTLDGLEITLVRGHSPATACLLHRADRALICGDTFMNLNDKLSSPMAMFTPDMALNRQGEARLVALDFDHLLPSHGVAILREGQSRAQGLVNSREKKK